MNGSIYLMRANPSLTTNVKIVVDTSYNMYLESYSTNRELSDNKYKKFKINENSFLSQRIASFYKGLPTDIAFDIKNDIKSDTIQNDYNNQFDDIYYSSARNVEDTRYTEEFQYNTTLKIDPNKLPKYFIIFRIDGPGLDEINELTINKYIDSFKLVQCYNLTSQTPFGRLWQKNYIDDDTLLRSSIEFNFKKFEFSKWNGYDYYSGGTVSKSLYIDEFMQNQTTLFEFENYITSGFKKNAIINAHFTNISFLFDDTISTVLHPSTTQLPKTYSEAEYPFISKYIQEGKILNNQYTRVFDNNLNDIVYTFNEHVPIRKKWTINRYTGLYIDNLIYIDKISPYIQPKFKENIWLVDNVFKTVGQFQIIPDESSPSVNPIVGRYNTEKPIYFKIENELYLIEFKDNQYVLISDKLFNGLITTFNNNAQKAIKIEYELDINDNIYKSFIKYNDNTYYKLKKYDTQSIFLIKLKEQYYVVKQNIDNKYYIQTDEYITCNSYQLYRKLGFNEAKIDSVEVITKDNNITYFEIYQLQITNVADWDFKRTNTPYAEIEYNKTDSVAYNKQFLFSYDIKDTAIPKDIYTEKYYKIWSIDETVIPSVTTLLYQNNFILPINSEYGASGDLYMLNKSNNLTKIWDLNQSITKWGILDSINNMSYPYRINNNLDICTNFNFTPNLYNVYVDNKDFTLDWFYTLGKPINYDVTNYDTLQNFDNNISWKITERTLNIDLPRIYYNRVGYNNIDYFYKFDINYYKDKTATIDYFKYILNLPVLIENKIGGSELQKYYERIAYFTQSDNVNGPSIFFKGFAAYLQYVQLENPNSLISYTTTPANDISGYGFSIIYTSRYTEDVNLLGKAGIEFILNKIYKNILVNIYVYTYPGTYTSLDFRERDLVYNEEYIYYTDYINNNYQFVQSQLKTQALTLYSFVNIVNNLHLANRNFAAGIKYTVIENIQEYKLSEQFTSTYNVAENATYVSIKINNNPFKQGDWIYFQNSNSLLLDNKNIQIINKIKNNLIQIKINGDVLLQLAAINYNKIIITKEKSILPFKFKIILPDEIKINRSINNIIGENINIIPTNSFKLNSDVLINVQDYTNDVPFIYVDDDISRRLIKTNLNTELSYTQLSKLPSIYRYSGDYNPILNNINLFNQASLELYNGSALLSTQESTYVKELWVLSEIPNIFTIKVRIMDTINQLYNPVTNEDIIKVGDVFYITNTDTYNWINYRTGHITSVVKTTDMYGNIYYELILNIIYNTNPLGSTTNVDLVTDGINMQIYLYKYNISNTKFDYNYNNFGKIDDLIIAKTYDTINPLQSSKDIYKTSNKYPMIDEHGVTTISRNIFKSSWDPAFYYKIISNKYKKKK